MIKDTKETKERQGRGKGLVTSHSSSYQFLNCELSCLQCYFIPSNMTGRKKVRLTI